jgi:DNA-binding NarL/FixJ family response regulator
MTLEYKRHRDFPLSLPSSILQRAGELAHREGLSLNHFIGLAIAEKVSRLDQGEIWASNEQLSCLVTSLSSSESADTTSSHGRSLTVRERQVLDLLADGRSNDELATVLNVSKSTIKNHLFNIYDKLGVSNRTEAILSVLPPHGTRPVPPGSLDEKQRPEVEIPKG